MLLTLLLPVVSLNLTVIYRVVNACLCLSLWVFFVRIELFSTVLETDLLLNTVMYPPITCEKTSLFVPHVVTNMLYKLSRSCQPVFHLIQIYLNTTNHLYNIHFTLHRYKIQSHSYNAPSHHHNIPPHTTTTSHLIPPPHSNLPTQPPLHSTHPGNTFPSNFLVIVRKVHSRLLQVLTHIYLCHATDVTNFKIQVGSQGEVVACLLAWMDGWLDGWLGGWMDGW